MEHPLLTTIPTGSVFVAGRALPAKRQFLPALILNPPRIQTRGGLVALQRKSILQQHVAVQLVLHLQPRYKPVSSGTPGRLSSAGI